MKKILSLFLVLAMLATSLVIFSSCGDSVSAEDVEKDPYTILLKASRNTGNKFFIVDENAQEIIENASSKGSYSIILGENEMFAPLSSLSSTLYADASNKKFVYDTEIDVDGEKFSEIVYVNPDSIALNANILPDRTLKIDFDTLVAKFKSSAFCKMTGLDGENDAEFVDQLIEAFKSIQQNMRGTYEDSLTDVNAYIKVLMGNVSEVTVTIDNEDVDCIKIPFNLNKTTLKAFVDKALADVNLPEDVNEEFEIEETVAQALEMIGDSSITFDVYVNADDTSFAKIDVNATVNMGGSEGTFKGSDITVKGSVFFAETRIVFNGSVTVGERSFTANAEITKETKDDVTTFKFSVGVENKFGAQSQTITFDKISASYNKKTGDVKISATLPDEIEATFSGNFKAVGSKVTMTASSISFTENGATDSLNFDVKLVIDSDPKIPETPKDAKDIMDLTEEEWQEISDIFGEGRTEDTTASADAWDPAFDAETFDAETN